VTTETIALYTTVCPIKDATKTPEATLTKEGSQPGATTSPVGLGGAGGFPQVTAVGQPSGQVVEAAVPTGAASYSSLQTLVKPATSAGAPQGSSGESSAFSSSPSQPTIPVGAGSPYPSGGSGSGSGSASPSGSWSGVPSGPSSPSIPPTSGASVMGASLIGLAIVMAVQIVL
jgi:chitinase